MCPFSPLAIIFCAVVKVPNYFSSIKFRRHLFQFILLTSLVLLILFLINNVTENMAARNMQTGFGFLWDKAGFPILFSPFIEYSPSTSLYFDTFFIGLGNTILVSILGIITATIVGFVIGVARLSSNWLVAKIASIYVETFRNIPLLVQITFWYFAILIPILPSPRQSMTFFEDWIVINNRGLYVPEPFGDGVNVVLIGIIIAIVVLFFWSKYAQKRLDEVGKKPMVFLPAVVGLIIIPLGLVMVSGQDIGFNFPEKGRFAWRGGWVIIPELAALWLALTIYTGAFIAENIRAGILAVPRGQTEASLSLGLTRSQNLRLVVIPQALRVIIPPQTSQYLNLTKNSSLATAVGYPDLVSVFTGTALNQIGHAIEIVVMTMAVYLTLSLTISVLMNIYNSRMNLKEK